MPPPPTAPAPTLEDFVRIDSALDPSFSADGRQLAFRCNRDGVFQAWVVEAGGEPAHAARRLTDTGGVVYPVRFRPRHGALLYVTDDGGDEHFALHLLELERGASRALAAAPGVIHAPGAWSRDGRRLSLASNRRDRRCLDALVLDLESGALRTVLRHDGLQAAGRFDARGAHVLVSRPNTELAGDADLWLAPAEGRGAARCLTAHRGTARWLMADFHPGGAVLALCDEGREFLGLQRIDPGSGEREFLLAPERDLKALALAPDGSKLAVVVNDAGCSRLELHALTGAARLGGRIPIEAPADGVIAGLEWRPDGGALAFGYEGPHDPPAVWLAEIDTGALRCVTRGRAAARIPRDALPAPEPVHYRSFDGLEIPAFFHAPPSPAGGGPLPCLVLVHGGPESQSRPTLWGRWAAPAWLLAAGRLALLVPNVRGSTGYGKRFSHADDRERRMDAVRDLIAAHDWLATHGAIDAARIGVMGASYGGFMTLAALAEAPERWAAGVDLFGIADFETFLRHTGPWRRRHRAAEYGDDPALLRRLSPIHRAARIRAPLMVIQGSHDVRVPPQESEQIVETVRARGGVIEYLRFEREGHGIQQLGNRLEMARRIAAFLERHLLSSRD